MSAHNIQLSDDELLGEFVSLEDFKGVLEKRLAVSPDLMGMVIRDGKVVSAGAGGNFSMGGFWRSIKDAIGGKHALRLLIADLKPFQQVMGIGAVSRDKVPVAGEITFELQINPERPGGVLGLMREHSAVYKGEVLDRIAPHIGDRVLEAVIGQVDAEEIRGSTMIQDKIQAEVMKEVERVAGDLGLMVRAASLRWEFNAEEIAAMEQRDMEREQARQDAGHAALKREVARSADVTALQISTELDEEKIKSASEDELRTMVLNQELTFNDAHDTGVRVAEMKSLNHEIDKLRTERMATIEAGIDNATGDIEKAKLQNELRKIQLDTEELETQQRLRLGKLEQMQELEISDAAHKQQIETVRGLQNVENEGRRQEVEIDGMAKDGDARRELDAKNADAQAELAKLKAMGDMSPELVLAINAGVSPAVAEVLVEQAKAQSGDTAEKMALMREHIDSVKQAGVDSADQAKTFFQTGMQGAVGVAQGSGGGSGAQVGSIGGGGGDAQEVECANSECRKMIPVSARFCRHCGHQMRS